MKSKRRQLYQPLQKKIGIEDGIREGTSSAVWLVYVSVL